MNMSVNVLDHISVTVSDLERSVAFYSDMLGMKVVERHLLEGETISRMTGKEGVVLQVVRLAAPDTPGILLDLQQYISPKSGVSNAKLGEAGHAHFCFGVPDVWEAYRELTAKGVEFLSEPVSFDLDWAILHVVFFTDPDGFVLELVESPIQPKPGHTVPGH